MKIKIEIIRWPAGLCLAVGDETSLKVVKGPHGGGIGTTIQEFWVNKEKLLKAIEAVKEKE